MEDFHMEHLQTEHLRMEHLYMEDMRKQGLHVQQRPHTLSHQKRNTTQTSYGGGGSRQACGC
jgi:hypothetical protein